MSENRHGMSQDVFRELQVASVEQSIGGGVVVRGMVEDDSRDKGRDTIMRG